MPMLVAVAADAVDPIARFLAFAALVVSAGSLAVSALVAARGRKKVRAALSQMGSADASGSFSLAVVTVTNDGRAVSIDGVDFRYADGSPLEGHGWSPATIALPMGATLPEGLSSAVQSIGFDPPPFPYTLPPGETRKWTFRVRNNDDPSPVTIDSPPPKLRATVRYGGGKVLKTNVLPIHTRPIQLPDQP
jgi:hypothetical protein